MVFYAGLNYDNPFIIKELAKESEGEVNCPVENTKNTNSFQFQWQKKLKSIDRNGEKKKWKNDILQIAIS